MTEVQRCGDLPVERLTGLLDHYGLSLFWIDDRESIPGSFWGDEEAGIIGMSVFVRSDTPIHSLLHEAGHIVCMQGDRRQALDTDALSDDTEENAVCYLQILLADEIEGVGKKQLMTDMDRWGYSFRLGSTQSWFENDAEDTRAWLLGNRLIDAEGRLVWRLRRA